MSLVGREPVATAAPCGGVKGGSMAVRVTGWMVAVAVAWVASVAVTRAAAPVGRYRIDGGVAYDTFTQLYWLTTPEAGPFDWQQANDHCAALDFGGSSSWRLPSMKELHTIIDETVADARVDKAVFQIPDGEYAVWSSSVVSHNTSLAYALAVGFANAEGYVKTTKLPILCVR